MYCQDESSLIGPRQPQKSRRSHNEMIRNGSDVVELRKCCVQVVIAFDLVIARQGIDAT